LLAHHRAEAVVPAARGNGLLRFRVVGAPSLGAENVFKEDHQSHADCKSANDHGEHAGLDISQFVQAPDCRGVMSAGNGGDPRLDRVKPRIDLSSINLVGLVDVAGIDRSEHAFNCRQVFLVDPENVADQNAVGGLA
jgi:hypothetical protein